MVRPLTALLVCAIALLEVPTAGAEMQVGAAVRLITPNPLLPVSGGMGRSRQQSRYGRRSDGRIQTE